MAGVANHNLLGVTVIGVQLGGIALAAAVIEKFGRRLLLIVSTAGTQQRSLDPDPSRRNNSHGITLTNATPEGRNIAWT